MSIAATRRAKVVAPAALPFLHQAQNTLTESQLDDLIKTHRGTLDDVLMTPVLAAYILKHYNTGNRRLRANHANSFSRALTDGRWLNTGEAVIFAREGLLNSGQHRLEGIVRSQIPAVMDLRFGIPREAFAITDTGAKRQAADVLSIEGSINSSGTAAAIKLLLAYEDGLPVSYNSRAKTGNDEVLVAYRRWPGMERAVGMAKTKLHRKGFVNASSGAFTFMALLETDEETVTAFLDLVESGLTRARDDAPRLLRERILADGSTRGDRATVIERLALFIKAWQFWREGTRPKPQALRWLSTEAFPKMNVTLP